MRYVVPTDGFGFGLYQGLEHGRSNDKFFSSMNIYFWSYNKMMLAGWFYSQGGNGIQRLCHIVYEIWFWGSFSNFQRSFGSFIILSSLNFFTISIVVDVMNCWRMFLPNFNKK